MLSIRARNLQRKPELENATWRYYNPKEHSYRHLNAAVILYLRSVLHSCLLNNRNMLTVYIRYIINLLGTKAETVQ